MEIAKSERNKNQMGFQSFNSSNLCLSALELALKVTLELNWILLFWITIRYAT